MIDAAIFPQKEMISHWRNRLWKSCAYSMDDIDSIYHACSLSMCLHYNRIIPLRRRYYHCHHGCYWCGNLRSTIAIADRREVILLPDCLHFLQLLFARIFAILAHLLVYLLHYWNVLLVGYKRFVIDIAELR